MSNESKIYRYVAFRFDKLSTCFLNFILLVYVVIFFCFINSI